MLASAQPPLALDPAVVAAVVALVRERTGADFGAYRPAMVARRIASRMASLTLRSASDYLARLAADPREPEALVERLTIKVSAFFRHPPAFEALRDVVLPALRPRAPLRVWSAGCGNGEEPWSIAMLLEEAGIAGSVLATDLDGSALEAARRGVYARAAIAGVPAALVDGHFEAGGGGLVRVRDHLRARLRFLRHDVTGEAPEDGSFELVLCRNVLIYLSGEVQRRTHERLLAALDPGGFLCLGEAEWPPAGLPLAPLGARTRIFRRSHA